MSSGTEVARPAGRLSQGFRFLGDTVEGGLRRANFWLLAAFSVAYFAGTFLLAGRKPAWYDEFFTLHLSQLPRLTDLWGALAEGTDLNPPLGYLATRLCRAVLGDSAWAARLPAVAGFWVLCLCLYRFVARRGPLLYAWVALLLPLTTVIAPFAYEARPYGLVLGCCGLSLVCWQSATEGKRRGPALAGLTLTLAAALWSHYYAVLLLVPLTLGEAVRTWVRRRVDCPIWGALGAAALSLGLLWPLIAGARSFTGGFWSHPDWAAVKYAYIFLLLPIQTPLVLLLVALVLYPERGRGAADGGPAPHEMAAALGLVALPLLGVLLGKCVTGVYTFRYVMPVVAGVSLVMAFVADRRSGGCPLLGSALVVCLLIVAWVQGRREYDRLTGEANRIAATCDYLGAGTSTGLPVAVAGPLPFLELVQQAPADLIPRLVYLSDPAASSHYLQEDTAEHALRHLRRWVAVNVVDRDVFLAEHRQFLVYGDGGWLRRALEATGARFEACGQCQGQGLYLVHTAGDARQAAAR
jgi:hypothetical protein